MANLIDDEAWQKMATDLGIKQGFSLSMARVVAEGAVLSTLYGVKSAQVGKDDKRKDRLER